MGALMHNLSAAAKLEGGPGSIAHDPVNLGKLVERVEARHQPLAELRGVELAAAVPESKLTCSGDVTLIEQAVGNLVQNAVRYNQRGGHVSVVLKARDGGFELRVIDDGPGASDEELAHMTERRFRAESARGRNPDGSGLGLHIAAEVVEQHGFQLSIERGETAGLVITIRG